MHPTSLFTEALWYTSKKITLHVLKKKNPPPIRMIIVLKKMFLIMNINLDKFYMAVCFWYLIKRDFSSANNCTVAYISTLFTSYQNNMAMFIWSG